MSTFSENLKGEKFNFQIPIFETKESNSSLKTSDSITTNSNIKQVSFKKDFLNVIIVENWKKYNYDISQFRYYWKDEENQNLKKEEINHINYIYLFTVGFFFKILYIILYIIVYILNLK
jgi:hypothetical protein